MAPPYQSKPLDHSLRIHELHYQLNLHHNQIQKAVVPSSGNRFGEIDVNDWTLTDPNQNRRIVGHAKGLRIQATQDSNTAARWHTSFDLVFEAGSGLEGSTLQVMGPDVLSGEWSIVGGTGTLTMARGIIYKKKLWDPDIVELHIHAVYIPMKKKRDSYDSRETNVWSW